MRAHIADTSTHAINSGNWGCPISWHHSDCTLSIYPYLLWWYFKIYNSDWSPHTYTLSACCCFSLLTATFFGEILIIYYYPNLLTLVAGIFLALVTLCMQCLIGAKRTSDSLWKLLSIRNEMRIEIASACLSVFVSRHCSPTYTELGWTV